MTRNSANTPEITLNESDLIVEMVIVTTVFSQRNLELVGAALHPVVLGRLPAPLAYSSLG